MKFLRFVAPASLCLAASVLAQDAPKPAAEPKPDVRMKIGGAEPAEVKRQLEALQAQLRTAQEEARTAQRAIGQKLRQQSDAARAFSQTFQGPRGGSDRRVFTYSVVGDSLGKTTFVKTFGLDFVEADPVLRSQLDIPAGEGLVIIAVTPGGLAERSGIKEMDLIAKIDLQPVASPTKARELITKGEKKSIYLDLFREGKPLHLSMDRPEAPAVPTTYWIGVSVAPVDATLRSHLGSLLADGGLIVTDVDAFGPAKQVGMQKNDILIRVDDQSIKTKAALNERVLNSEGKAIKVELLRAGKVQSLALIPAKRTSHAPAAAGTFSEAVKDLTYDPMLPWTVRVLPDGMAVVGNGPATGTLGQVNPLSKNPNGLRIYSGPGDDAKSLARVEAEMTTLTEQIARLGQEVANLSKQLDANKRSKDDK